MTALALFLRGLLCGVLLSVIALLGVGYVALMGFLLALIGDDVREACRPIDRAMRAVHRWCGGEVAA